jgi:hypothetical protein
MNDTNDEMTSNQNHLHSHRSTVIDGTNISKMNTAVTSTSTLNPANMQHCHRSETSRCNVEGANFVEEDVSRALHNVANYHLVEKAVEINLVLSEPEIDLWRLRELAISEGGLVNGKCS